MGTPRITKADGSQELFRIEKLLTSLTRAGATQSQAEHIAEGVAATIHDGDSTQSIYREAFKRLRKQEKPLAAKYSVRRALFDLGPTGFPFERYIADIFAAKGYVTAVGVTVSGACIAHEVDVLAKNDRERVAIEAKFHSKQSFRSDSKVALYVSARMQDLVGGRCDALGGGKVDRGLLVTNTKLTTDARKYAVCAGLDVVSWEYPTMGNLMDLIHETKVYPVTVLTTLNHGEKRFLLDRNISLCSSILKHRDALADLGVPADKASAVLEETERLCAGAVHVE